MLREFSENIFTKLKISRDPVDRFWWKAVRFELKVCSFRFWKRELPENLCREDWTGSRFGKCSDFWSIIAKIKGILFLAALPGAQALTCFRPHLKNNDMTCTDVQGIFCRTNAMQIVARMASAFSKNIITKMQISRDPVDRFWWKAVRFEWKAYSFRFWKRELPENVLAKIELH